MLLSLIAEKLSDALPSREVGLTNHLRNSQPHLLREHRSLRSVRCRCVAQPPLPPPSVDEQISSTANQYVKHCVRLRTNRQYRQETGRLILSGTAPLAELAAAGGDVGSWTLLTTDGGQLPFGPVVAVQKRILVTATVMKKLAGLDSAPTGFQAAAEMPMPPPTDLAALSRLDRLLVLEGLQDPGNLGTLMRSALALGWQAVYFLPGCCDLFNDKALRASRGAAFKLPYASGSWRQLLEIVERHQLTCLAAQPPAAGQCGLADPGADTLGSSGMAAAQQSGFRGQGVCLVLGAEGQGLSPETLEVCQPIGIPMAGDMESLNVAAAGNMLMLALSDAMPFLIADIARMLDSRQQR